ncbi:AMP-binding protein, partial [Photobacterium galatheae]
AFLPTALFNYLGDKLAGTSLKVLHVGGESLNPLAQLPVETLFNQYGPTEATVCATQKTVLPNDVSIGAPISNTQLYVLD